MHDLLYFLFAICFFSYLMLGILISSSSEEVIFESDPAYKIIKAILVVIFWLPFVIFKKR